MNASQYLVAVIGLYTIVYVVESLVNYLNIKAIRIDIPGQFHDVYDRVTYKRSQEYLKANTWLNFMESSLLFVITTPFILFGGFNFLDQVIRGFGFSIPVTGVLFVGSLLLLNQLIQLPFSLYHTFVLEKKYEFNQTSLSTYFLDLIKGTIITILIGTPILMLVFWFFQHYQHNGWLYCWIALSIIQLLIMVIAPVAIMPLFNKFQSLPKGELRDQIEDYAQSQDFILEGIYTMDGSKRSKKTNAFFTGFGPFKRIVLYDTLIQKHPTEEIVTIVAHEMGHYKKKHIYKMILVALVQTFFMLWLLSHFINNVSLFGAFKMDQLSIYASLIFFSLLFSPIETVLSVFSHALSRRFEYEADDFAVQTTGKRGSFIRALKALSKDNLTNLTPHPIKVILDYSHPTAINRIDALMSKR